MATQVQQSSVQQELNNKEKQLEQKRFDGASRFSEFSRIFSGNATTAIDDATVPDLNEASEITTIVSAAASVAIPGIWLAFRKKASDGFAQKALTISKKLNPWYRRFKTAFVIGNDAGALAANFIPLPPIPGLHLAQIAFSNVLGSVTGILFGAFAATFLPDNCADNIKHLFTFGVDGWTKYAKVGFEYGGNVGIVIGGVLGFLTPIPGGAFVGMLIGKLAGCFIGAGISMVAVPFYNKFFGKTGEKSFRTNTIRAGDAIGLATGMLIGTVLGTFLFPGIGTAIGMTLGGAIGAIAGGTILGFFGGFISKKVDPKNSSANSWDYGLRTGGLLGSNYGLGAIFTAVLPNKISLICAAAVTIVGSLIGAGRELYHSFKRTSRGITEKEAYHLLPWTQSFAAGAIAGSLVGNAVGFAFPNIGLLISGTCGLVAGITTTAFCSNWFGKLFKRNTTIANENLVEPATTKDDKLIGTYKNVGLTLNNSEKLPIPTAQSIEVSTDLGTSPYPNAGGNVEKNEDIISNQISSTNFFAHRPPYQGNAEPVYNTNYRSTP